MSIDEFAQGIGGSRESLQRAAGEVLAMKTKSEELASTFAGIGAESMSQYMTEVTGQLDTVHQALIGVAEGLEQTQATAAVAKEHSGGGLLATSTPRIDPTRPTPDIPALARNLGEQLPAWRKRQPARAFAYTSEDSTPIEFTSGNEPSAAAGLTEEYRNRWVVTDHIEGKLGARMRQQDGPRDVTLIINKDPCPGPMGCDSTMPGVIPEGSTVTIYVRAADGVRHFGTYRGTGEGIA